MFDGELKITDSGKKKFTGLHYDNGNIKYEFLEDDFIDSKIDYSQFKDGDIVIIGKNNLQNGFYDGRISYFDEGRYLGQIGQTGMINPKGFITKADKSTFFPDSWSKEKIKNDIAEAYGNMTLKETYPDGTKRYNGFSEGGQEYEIIENLDGSIDTVYGIFN